MSAAPVEVVVLVDEDGHPVGTAPKATVHDHQTPLHLAFSCYIFDHEDRLLLTRRALSKPTWPGTWTNSFCGHPAPAEDIFEAVRRRARQELGISLDHLQLTLPAFRYDATMANGTRENELCPVFTATTPDEIRPEPKEAPVELPTLVVVTENKPPIRLPIRAELVLGLPREPRP